MVMTEAWKQWEGRVLDQSILLGRYLGGDEDRGVFATEFAGQKAAVKLIPIDPGTADFHTARLEAASRLSHPHLLGLLYWGVWRREETCLLFIVTEYAAENLGQVIPQRALSPDEAREVLTSALDALAYLHAEGFVHGHLKPSNVLAVEDRVKLSTDGLCRIGESPSLPGKPGPYDPPEAGRAAAPAGDLWSLAVTMVEILTQRLPALEAGEGRLPEPLPSPFQEIARNCLVVDPRSRWTARRARAGLSVDWVSDPIPSAAGLREAWIRNRYVLPAAAAGLVLIAVLAVLTWASLTHRPGPKQSAVTAPVAPPSGTPAPGKPAAPPTPKRLSKKKTDAGRPSPFARKLAQDGAPRPAPESAGSPPPAPPAVPEKRAKPGSVVHEVLPAVPAKARATIQGKVRVAVAVRVDPAGKVTQARLESAGPSRYFAALALEAARGWKFAAPRRNGQDVASAWVLRFEFRRNNTKAHASRASLK